MATGKTTRNGHLRRLSRAEARAILDGEARRTLGMSGDHFVRLWRRGRFKDPDSRPEVMRVAMLLPLAR